MTMTKLDWLKLITTNKEKKTRIEHYDLPLPNFTRYLRTWGEVGIIKTGKDGIIGDRCENILCGYLYDGDLVFVSLKGIYGFKFPKRFLEISSRDLTSSLLFI